MKIKNIFGDRVLVKPVVIEVKTNSGIILDGVAGQEAESYFGEIVMVGPGAKITVSSMWFISRSAGKGEVASPGQTAPRPEHTGPGPNGDLAC